MYVDTVYTRDNVKTAKGHMARRAESLLATYRESQEVLIVRRGNTNQRIAPGPHQIVYVAATGGKWGRSAETRIGARCVARLPVQVAVGSEMHIALEAAFATLATLHA